MSYVINFRLWRCVQLPNREQFWWIFSGVKFQNIGKSDSSTQQKIIDLQNEIQYLKRSKQKYKDKHKSMAVQVKNLEFEKNTVTRNLESIKIQYQDLNETLNETNEKLSILEDENVILRTQSKSQKDENSNR